MTSTSLEAFDLTYRLPDPTSPIPGAALDAKIHFVPELYNSHFLERFTQRVRYRTPIAMDIETTGLKIGADNFKIRTIQVGTKEEAWVIPDVDDNIELVYDALLRGICPIETQGGVFDWVSLMVLYGKAELDPERLIDTKILAHHWDPRTKDYNAPGHSLDALIRIRISEDVADDVKAAPGRIAGELGITKEEYFATVPLDNREYVRYAGMDVVCTDIIRERIMRDLEKSFAAGIHSKELLRTDHEDMLQCIYMGERGMKVNRPYFEELDVEFREKYDRAMKEAEELGVTSLFSAQQLGAKFEEDGLPVAKKTKTGKPKVDRVELQRQADKGSRLAEVVLEGKRAKKWNEAYVGQILSSSTRADRIHPKFDPLGARTGRYSASEPAVQQLPSHTDIIRSGFEVDYPDLEVVVSIDYQGQELRLLGALSQDAQLCEDLDSGKKPAKLLAARIYGQNYSDLQYVRTKNTLYGTMYGAGPKKLAEQAGISMDESKAVMNELFTMYPDTKTYSQQLMQIAGRQGYVTNLAGRLLIVDSNRIYSALNYMLQSTGRELIAAAGRDIGKSRWAESVRLLVHDEIVLVVKKNFADTMIREVSELMDTSINGMHFPVEAEVCGTSWSGHYDG